MRKKFQTWKDALVAWTVRHAESKNAKWWLFGVAFSESSFFPIPPDVLLVAILMTRERVRAYFYAGITVFGSVLGGLFGYAIGYFLFQTVGVWIVSTYHLEAELIVVQKLFSDNAFWAIFAAAFTPIPYKIFTISAGLFMISIPVFVVASVLGRGLRFFIVATIMKFFGEKIKEIFYKYVGLISLIIFAMIVGLYFLIKN